MQRVYDKWSCFWNTFQGSVALCFLAKIRRASRQLNPELRWLVCRLGGLFSFQGRKKPSAGKASSENVSEMDSRWFWFTHRLFGTCWAWLGLWTPPDLAPVLAPPTTSRLGVCANATCAQLTSQEEAAHPGERKPKQVVSYSDSQPIREAAFASFVFKTQTTEMFFFAEMGGHTSVTTSESGPCDDVGQWLLRRVVMTWKSKSGCFIRLPLDSLVKRWASCFPHRRRKPSFTDF